ncbi:putative ribonuclease H-like domain-containing protein [Tanacetum coccineum]
MLKLYLIHPGVEAMQEELLQFKLQQVWILVDLPNGKKAIRTKWVLEAIRLFLAMLLLMGFLVYQMDVKSAFLYGTIEEEVYVTQPPGFKDPDHPDKVYKVVKALYRLHQAPRAWYETLANNLLRNGFKRGKIDQTLFIKKQKGDILLVHVYVDDIIFGSTNKELCIGFEKLMKDKFQMSSMEINYSDVKSASTLVDLEKTLVKDGDVDDVDVHLYRSMIRSLMYLTASRPDIMFIVCSCARFQVTPKTLHLLAVKRIFRYLKGKPTLGLWYSRDSPFELVAYTDSDYAGATLDRKSTTGGCQFLGNRLISWQCKKQIVVATSTTKAEYVAAASYCGQFNDEAVHKELGDRMERAATTASSLEAEQDSGSGPRCQDTILGDVNAQTRIEITSIQSIDPPISITHLEVGRTIVNGVRQLQALVDKKRVIVTESSIRRDLYLDDAEGTDCLPTATIFEELARMGAKSTAWNEFSSSMASLIICLATNQKFNLSKYIFDAMVKHLDGGVKFLLYPRFLQVFINQQLGNMSTHKKIFVNPFHTKKVFANMKRAGKDFSGRITPLFDTMMVQPVEEMGEDSDHPTDSTPIPIIDQPSSSSQPKKDKSSKKAQRQEAEVPQDEAGHEESVPTPSNDPQPSVLDLQKAKDAQAKEIAALKKRIQRVESSKDQESLGVPEDASKQGRSIADIDADVEVTLVDETQVRQNDDLIFDTRVLDDVEMPVEAKVDGKDEQSTKTDDSTAGEAVTIAGDDIFDDVEIHVEAKVDGKDEQSTKTDDSTAGEAIKAAKPKVVTTAATTATTTNKDRRVVVQEPSEFRVPQEIKPLSSKDKGKGIMIEPEVPLKRKDQIALDEQIGRDIQAKLDAELLEEKKLARKQKEEASIALIESWENTQAMIEADRLLAERLQSKEREELADEEKAKLFMELMEKRRKHFAALRA